MKEESNWIDVYWNSGQRVLKLAGVHIENWLESNLDNIIQVASVAIDNKKKSSIKKNNISSIAILS